MCVKDETIVFAPVSGDASRFIEFKVREHLDSPQSFDLIRTVVDSDSLAATVSNSNYTPVLGYPVRGDTTTCPRHLKHLTVIDSRKSGNGSSELYFSVLSPLLHELGIGHVYVATDGPDTIKDHARSFSTSSTVVLMGGDTSVHEFVNALPDQPENEEMRLVIVPTGTGNALANSVGLSSPIMAIRRLLTGAPEDFRPLSTFKVNFPGDFTPVYALVVVSWGFHSAIVADSDTPELRKFGVARFRMAAEKNLNEIKQEYHGRLVLGDGRQLGGNTHSYLLFTLVHSLEPGFVISPKSKPPSSQQVWAVRIPTLENGDQMMDIMREAYDHGKHVNDSRVDYFSLEHNSIASITVEPQDAYMRRWCVDGRIVVAEPGVVTIDPASHNCKGWHLKIVV